MENNLIKKYELNIQIMQEEIVSLKKDRDGLN